MKEVLSWEYVKKEIENGENAVLLGNGFSRSYKADEFEQCKILSEMESLNGKTVFDIEKCIQDTQHLLTENENTVPKTVIAKWIKENLHKEFISKLFEKMPDSIRDKDNYDEVTLKPYNEFLSNFNNFFTLNYDPVFYWMSLHFQFIGDEDIKKIWGMEEELDSMSKDDKKYPKKQENLDKEYEKIRKKTFVSYIDRDKYKLIINFKDTCIFNKTITEAEADQIIAKKIIQRIYDGIAEKKDNEINCKDEYTGLEKYKDGYIDCSKREIEIKKENIFINSTDGFFTDGGVLKWNEENRQNVFYLHGAFHLLTKDNETIKLKAAKDDPSNKMRDNIKKEWENGFESLTVLEGTSEEKIKKINDFDYLKHCYNKLKNISGNLVTFGVSFEDSDNHIIEAINNNPNLEKIFIGCYDLPCDAIVDKFSNNDRIKLFSTKDFFNISR